ncbi:MAG: HNH endonuclease, partial [Burkholderiales bacterium]
HHVAALSEGGADTDDNVVALCPNHHREAHHGARKREMGSKLQVRLRKRLKT